MIVEIASEGDEGLSTVGVRVEPERFVMVKTEETSCGEPCDSCIQVQCDLPVEGKHHVHECRRCSAEKEKLEEKAKEAGASRQAVRNGTKWKRPESFHYLVDKTVCLFRGISESSSMTSTRTRV